ncbi:MAG: transcriptional regulator, MerR family [Mycobacterium sp.]|nr:transcriptional regulator, MerR family [Mycobacterium sp.]
MTRAGANAASSQAYMSIGEVLAQLRPEFPDTTISKLRFLESEGLVEPERTAAGYRKYSREDVARLRYVLTAQRDHYLPLRVIREQLDAIDRGLEPAGPVTGNGSRGPRSLTPADGLPTADDFVRSADDVRLSREELLERAGLTDEQLRQLEQYGLVTRRSGGYYDGDALLVSTTVVELARYGLEPRHLRAYRSAADREVGLFEQVVTPMVRQRNPEAKARAAETVRELAALSVRLHAALVQAGLRSALGG